MGSFDYRFTSDTLHGRIAVNEYTDEWGPYTFDLSRVIPPGGEIDTASATSFFLGTRSESGLVEPESVEVVAPTSVRLRLQWPGEGYGGSHELHIVVSVDNPFARHRFCFIGIRVSGPTDELSEHELTLLAAHLQDYNNPHRVQVGQFGMLSSMFIKSEAELLEALSDSAVKSMIFAAPISLTANRTITKACLWLPECPISTNGYQLAIAAPMSAGPHQIFDASLGDVTCSPGATGDLACVWFGAVGDSTGPGYGTDDSDAIETALRCAIDSRVPLVVPKTRLYRITRPLTFTEVFRNEFSRLHLTGPYPTGKQAINVTEGYEYIRGGFLKDFVGGNMFSFLGLEVGKKMRGPIITGVAMIGDNETEEDASLLYIKDTNAASISHNIFAWFLGNGLLLVNSGDSQCFLNLFQGGGSATYERYQFEAKETEVELPATGGNQFYLWQNHFENFRCGAILFEGFNEDQLKLVQIRIAFNKVHGRRLQSVKETGAGITLRHCKTYSLLTGNCMVALTNEGILLDDSQIVHCSENFIGTPGYKVKLVNNSWCLFKDNHCSPGVQNVISSISRTNPAVVTLTADHSLTAEDINGAVYLDGIEDEEWAAISDSNIGLIKILAIPDTNQVTLDVDTSGMPTEFSESEAKMHSKGIYLSGNEDESSTIIWDGNYFRLEMRNANDFYIPPGYYGDPGYENLSRFIYRHPSIGSAIQSGPIQTFGVFGDAETAFRVQIMGEPMSRMRVRPKGIFIGDGQSETVRVVGPQQTGVPPMTNVVPPVNWNASTVTTQELANIVGTLITKLRKHGLVTGEPPEGDPFPGDPDTPLESTPGWSLLRQGTASAVLAVGGMGFKEYGGGSGRSYWLRDDIEEADHYVQIRQAAFTTAQPNSFLALRVVNENIFAGYRLNSTAAGGAELVVRESGTLTTLETWTGALNQVIRVTAVGNVLTVYLWDGVEWVQQGDSHTLSSTFDGITRAGFVVGGNGSGASADLYFDDFEHGVVVPEPPE